MAIIFGRSDGLLGYIVEPAPGSFKVILGGPWRDLCAAVNADIRAYQVRFGITQKGQPVPQRVRILQWIIRELEVRSARLVRAVPVEANISPPA